ncbi:MAG: radical SAM protein, partial [Sulfuricurvum sp.]|nr:radical SAM protein [Sulfuricurvum sp.]
MLQDRFDRKVTYLRVSVTERCNFRCRYCMAEKPFSWVPKENLLSYEELFAFIKIGIDNGIRKIRLTGGEPTTRENHDELIAMIHTYAPDGDIGLTTNGLLLPAQA